MNQPQQPIELPREPSLNELCCISAYANIAYAVRCGRRVQPKYQPQHEQASKLLHIVESSLRWTELSLTHEMPVDESVQALLDAATAVAEMSSDTNDFPAYAALHSVRSAVMLAEKPELASEAFLEIVAAAYGASRVLLSSVPVWIQQRTIEALRADYHALVALKLGEGNERGLRVDPTVTGPLGNLWGDNPPTW